MSKLENNFWVLTTKNRKSASVSTRIFTTEDVEVAKAWLAESRKAKAGNVFVTLTQLDRIYNWLKNDEVSTRFFYNLKAIDEANIFKSARELYIDVITAIELREQGKGLNMEVKGEGYSIVVLDYFDPKVYAEKTDADSELADVKAINATEPEAIVEEPVVEEKPKKKRGRKPKKVEAIKTICYGNETVWDSRQEAIDYFAEGVAACEGSEQERYASILAQLESGSNLCTDEPA